MATNRNILSEQIQRLYSRNIDREDISRLDVREIKLLINQGINFLVKTEMVQRVEVTGCILATYNLTKQTESGVDYVQLSVVPISLPKEQGIHRVFKKGCPWEAFIPIRSNDFQIIQGTPSQFIEGQVGYIYEGNRISFTKPVAENITVKLVVSDPAILTDSDILPIPPEMEGMLIEYVLTQLGLSKMSADAVMAKNERKTNVRQLD